MTMYTLWDHYVRFVIDFFLLLYDIKIQTVKESTREITTNENLNIKNQFLLVSERYFKDHETPRYRADYVSIFFKSLCDFIKS